MSTEFPLQLIVCVERPGYSDHPRASVILIGPSGDRVWRGPDETRVYHDDGRRTLVSEEVFGDTDVEAAQNILTIFRERIHTLDPD